ncbi:hypothetical protein PFISCL1PPCAC_8883, partial [Pristionchus fissidentatus]
QGATPSTTTMYHSSKKLNVADQSPDVFSPSVFNNDSCRVCGRSFKYRKSMAKHTKHCGRANGAASSTLAMVGRTDHSP